MIKAFYLCFLSIIVIFSSIIRESNSLVSKQPTKVEKNFVNGLIKYDATIGYQESILLCCKISNFKGSKMVITIQSNSGISTNYYQSSSNKAESIDDTMKRINTTTLSLSYDEIQNIILTLNNIEENPFLYISMDNYYDNKKKILLYLLVKKKVIKQNLKLKKF